MIDLSPTLLDVGKLLATACNACLPTLGAELAIELSLPVVGDEPSARQERASPGVIVSLGFGPAPDAAAAWLWLDAAFASNLVDRALGGRGQLGIATATGLPSEAECGVLAYLAARSARAFESVWIRDVVASRDSPPSASIVWPLSVRWNGGSGVARLGLGASFNHALLSARIGWFDGLSEAALTALEVGDVLISDGVALSATTRGLAGSCLLHVRGLSDTLRVVLESNQLHGRRAERVKPRTDELFVELQALALSVADLARLTAGGEITLPPAQAAQVQLTRNEQPLAQGELVQVAGSIGVRICAISPSSHAR